ncbi:Thiamin diphosphate-binding protein [Protomyces lactucae-debilis]|uniref:Thiamin diphosphate-binding protein n=1 Tax=Protomyces lactucae-debilis TaxID=2754530 RepID=A0A1Y2FUZ5_PROLT|nr:thiamine diphosphate-binding protein [Protomyces lactucae-debilis]ORY87114.1 Thiamin diphosphate-binding protein [Protomyces lactucae-debilis]
MSITLSKYLLARQVFGVPGDFNLHFLDNIEEDDQLEWIGATNELNGAYAADGYARVVGAGFFVSTCGVGELSALNAFCGSYAEQIPVIHLVGTPSTQLTNKGLILHHTLGPQHNPDTFPRIWETCTVAQVNMTERTTPKEIDAAIEACIRRNQPIYISLPQDLVNLKFDAKALETPLNLEQPENWPEVEPIVVDHIVGLLKESKAPVLIMDAGANRDHIEEECDQLIRALPNVPYFQSAMGKSSVSEHYPNYAGVYCGSLSLESIEKTFQAADLVIFLGHINVDLNTGFFSCDTSKMKVVELHSTYTLVRGGRFERVGMKRMLPQLIKKLQNETITSTVPIPKDLALPRPKEPSAKGLVSYPFFWSRVEEYIQSGDVLFAEPGTCGFGLLDLKLPEKCKIVAQYMWASIGFGTASLVGGAAARTRRCIGFLGDGSYQMSFGELSTVVRYNLPCTIFLMNNEGYTVEKYLHGVKKHYNQINTKWRYLETMRYFGGDSELTWLVDTEEKLVQLFKDPKFLQREGCKFVEVRLPELDGGRLLTQVVVKQGRMGDDGAPIDYNEVGKPY